MAARWRGKDAYLNADRGDFLANNTSDKLVLGRCDAEAVEMDSQSCTDHSILSLFDIPTVASEGKSGAEEESLLSALTEMLDSVEDDDRTLSPFDVLPDTKLLTRPRCRDPSVVFSLSGRSAPKPRSPTVTFTVNTDGDKESEDTKPLRSEAKKAENEVEVFTSSSLVNLVRLMHPYCLKLHVEEEGSQRKQRAVFSQEEVLRYKRPNDESDEEINVVSDDEEPAKEPAGVEKRDVGTLRKSVLLTGSTPRAPRAREKKRVSFGPVQVASFTDPVELNEKNHTGDSVSVSFNGTKAAESALDPQAVMSSERNCKKVDDPTAKRETKAKSLSLQQYRQLRRKRQPLVEKQGNNTTKWPSVPEPPMELPPILCLDTQRQNCCGPKTAYHRTSVSPDHLQQHEFKTSQHAYPLLTKPSTHRRGGLKRQRPESRSISPASPLTDATTSPNLKASKRIRSSAKKPTPLSSDPPNPVLVPLLVCHTESKVGDSSHQGTTPLEEVQSETSATCLQREPPSSEVLSVNQDSTNVLQESKSTFTEIVSDVSSRSPAPCPTATQSEPGSEETELHRKASASPSGADPERQRKCLSSTPSPADASSPVKEPVLTASLQVCCTEQKVTSESGIEAPDLTSLLEQFEETQAKEERVCENQPGLDSLTLTSSLQTHGHMELNSNQPVSSGKTSRLLQTASVEPPKHLSTSESSGTPKTFRNLVDVPEPLGTDVVLSTRQEQPARRKNPPSKAIQIIDPRPLPPRRTPISTLEPLAPHASLHLYLSVSSDHDYCGTVDHSPTCATQRSRNKPSVFKEKITNEVQVTSLGSGASAERKTQIRNGPTKSVSQHHSEVASGTDPATGEALQLSHCCAATGDAGAGEDKRAAYILPTPPPSPPVRGREKMRYRRRSPRSDSSSSCSSSSSSPSSSRSRSPKRRRRSDSSSSSASPCRSASHSPSPRRFRLSYSRSRCSRSRSRSWSRSPSRSRTPSPLVRRQQWKDVYRSREARRLRREHEMRIQKLKAIDERRVVYVGRIRRSMTHNELRERFTQFGEVECVSLHFRDRGDHYGFVTFYNTEDAFAAIDNGGKLRKPDELPFDLCFGGRRQFCNSNYADLDANRDVELSPVRNRFEDHDFDSLLKQAQRGLKR